MKSSDIRRVMIEGQKKATLLRVFQVESTSSMSTASTGITVLAQTAETKYEYVLVPVDS
jgi:hypothetical protein